MLEQLVIDRAADKIADDLRERLGFAATSDAPTATGDLPSNVVPLRRAV
jgi:hypothetical protein